MVSDKRSTEIVTSIQTGVGSRYVEKSGSFNSREHLSIPSQPLRGNSQVHHGALRELFSAENALVGIPAKRVRRPSGRILLTAKARARSGLAKINSDYPCEKTTLRIQMGS